MSIELFPAFSKNKYSIRICNTKYEESPVKFVSVSKPLKERLSADRLHSFIYVDSRRKSIVISKNPDKGLRVDLTSISNQSICDLLKEASFEQGVTYFGQERNVRRRNGTLVKAIEFKTSSMPKAIRQNKKAIEALGVPVY